MYMRKLLSLILLLCGGAMSAISAQTAFPSAEPAMTITTEDGEQQETSYSGSAPVQASFRANPTNVGEYTPYYEWRFYTPGNEQNPTIIRYDEDTEYTFTTSGTMIIELLISFINGTDTIIYEMDEPFQVTVSESKLEFPNIFTPNGDGINDVFRAKEGYQSIVKFEAAIFNRWGRKLYEWNDPAGGWDGKFNGSDVPAGAYYFVLKAQGADGVKYNMKKTINLLRGYSEEGTTTIE